MREINEILNSSNISLNYDFDSKSRRALDKCWWVDLYNILKFKIDKIVRERRKKLLYKFIKNKLKKGEAINPHLMTVYSGEYWLPKGIGVFKDVTSRVKELMDDKRTNVGFLYESVLKEFYADQIIFESQNIINNRYSNKLTPIFFDSNFLFNGGHPAALEETLDVIMRYQTKEFCCYFFVDRHMVLFPSLANQIFHKYKNSVVIDCTEKPIRFPHAKELWLLSQQLKVERDLFEICSNIESANTYAYRTPSFFNPFIHWIHSDKNYRFQKVKSSWLSKYTKSDSQELVINYLKKAGCINHDFKRYVVIHLRNEYFSKCIRNTFAPIERKKLLESITSSGMGIIVLGTNRSSAKYSNESIVYLDEFGSIPDDFQIHVISGAEAFIGSASGITTMTYCTNTPLLLIDMHKPFFAHIPQSGFKVLMKRIKTTKKELPISSYYDTEPVEYWHEQKAGLPWSPLFEKNCTLNCVTDESIFNALMELLSNKDEYNSFNRKHKCSISKDFQFDIDEIKRKSPSYQRRSPFSVFSSRDYALANWIGSSERK